MKTKPLWHWTNQSNAEEIKKKLVKTLRSDNWKGKHRDSKTIRKLNVGKDKWIKENPEKYKESRRKATRHLLGKGNPRWNGGKTEQGGYILVRMKNHPFTNKHGYVREHRLIMEKYIGRYLTQDEVIHHVNGNKKDNRIKNLELVINQSRHLKKEWELGKYNYR